MEKDNAGQAGEARFEFLSKKRFREGLSDKEAEELGRLFAEGRKDPASEGVVAERVPEALNVPEEIGPRRFRVYAFQRRWGLPLKKMAASAGLSSKEMAGSFDSLDEAIAYARSLSDAEIFLKDSNGSDYIVVVRAGGSLWPVSGQAGRLNSLSDAIRYAEALTANDV